MPGKDINVDEVSDMASSKSSMRHRRGGGSTKIGIGSLGGEESSSNVERRTMQPRSDADSGALFKKTTGKLGFRASNALASI